jgi:hypothetical protein
MPTSGHYAQSALSLLLSGNFPIFFIPKVGSLSQFPLEVPSYCLSPYLKNFCKYKRLEHILLLWHEGCLYV